MAKKKMKAQTTSRPISAKELKFWLEGILEFQDDKWVPNAEQWKNIQEKIFNLQEAPEIVHVNQPTRNTGFPSFQLQNGGAAGLPATNFPEGAATALPPIGAPNIPSVPSGPMPVRDENGFLKMPDNSGIGEDYVEPSSGKVHKLKNSFE